MTDFCLGDEFVYLLPTNFFADGFLTDKVVNLECPHLSEKSFTNENVIYVKKQTSCSHIESSSIQNEAFSLLISTKSLSTKYLKKSECAASQGFFILMNVYGFFKLSTPWMYIHVWYEQYIFITYNSAAREWKIFQQLTKLIKLASISPTCPH